MMKLDDAVAARHEKAHEGHLFCYVPSSITATLWRLSIVRDGEEGHYPISEDYFMGIHQSAIWECDRLNRDRLKLPRLSVVAIIASSMRGARRRTRG